MITVVLLALALRLHLLDGQSFWSDEGISLLRSALPLAEMMRNMPVEHLPGYFVLLFGWLRVAGTSDYALRFDPTTFVATELGQATGGGSLSGITVLY